MKSQLDDPGRRTDKFSIGTRLRSIREEIYGDDG